MGKKSKSRRNSNARKHASTVGLGLSDDGRAAEHESVEAVHRLWAQVVIAPTLASPHVRARVHELADCPDAAVDASLELFVFRILDWLWHHGWQPVEVVRQARRVNAPTARFVHQAILADNAGHAGQRIDPRWAAQLTALGRQDASPGPGWVARWSARERLDREACLTTAAGALHTLRALPAVDCLIPPPDAPRSVTIVGPADRPGSDHPVLARIRKLLAKAEATNFEEEAVTFTAKAQELMTRYAIDDALLNEATATDGPVTIRIPIDPPYADAKVLLLSVVAQTNRCRAVDMTRLGLCSVLGHAQDLAAVEVLFTSLLVQAQNALAEAGRGATARRARSTGYRSSFYLAYGRRIGERLIATTTEVVSQSGGKALPALRNRERAVDDYLTERYGDTLVTTAVRGGYDPAGLAHGRRAADEAVLNKGQIA